MPHQYAQKHYSETDTFDIVGFARVFIQKGRQEAWQESWHEGWREGWHEGWHAGWREGWHEGQKALIQTLLARNYTHQAIMDLFGFSPEELKTLLPS